MTTQIILIVSASSTNLSILKRALKETSHLIEKRDAESALLFLKTSSVDLIILDSKIKEGDIFKTIQEIHAAVLLETPILLITSNIKKSFVQLALRSGITDFLNEPLDIEEIEQRIAVAFKIKDRSKRISQIAQQSTLPVQFSQPNLSERKILNDQAIKEIAKARKTSTIITLLMIELDSFQKLPASKSAEALSLLTAILERNLRKNDILIPQSPGKMIVMLPKTSRRAADIMAETIRMDVKRVPSSIPLSVSIGLISLDKTAPSNRTAADEFDHLIKGVEQSMVEAKKTGKRIVSSDSL